MGTISYVDILGIVLFAEIGHLERARVRGLVLARLVCSLPIAVDDPLIEKDELGFAIIGRRFALALGDLFDPRADLNEDYAVNEHTHTHI